MRIWSHERVARRLSVGRRGFWDPRDSRSTLDRGWFHALRVMYPAKEAWSQSSDTQEAKRTDHADDKEI